MDIKRGYLFVLVILILFASFVITQLNMFSGSAIRTKEVGEDLDGLGSQNLFLSDKLTDSDVEFLKEVYFRSENNPLYKALKILKENGDKELIKQNLEKYPGFISSLQGQELYNAVEELYNAKDSFPQEFENLFPDKINLANYPIMFAHGEEVDSENGKVKRSLYRYAAIIDNKEIDIVVIGDIKEGSQLWNAEGYLYDDEIYIKIDKISSQQIQVQSSGVRKNSIDTITGYQVYSPPTPPFNQRAMNVGILLPYYSAVPLPVNYQTFLQPILNNVKQYFLDNSENQTLLNFTINPFFFDYSSGFNILAMITAGDPYVDYSLYDFVMIVLQNQWCCYGWASMTFSGNTPYYYQTNDGPLASAVPLVGTNFSIPDFTRTNEYIIEHEIGHELSFWNPQVNPIYYFGYVPHAAGLYGSSCYQFANIIICQPDEYGDKIDVMGTGRGSFHYHQRAFFMGLSPVSKVQSVTGSGISNLCDIHHNPPAGCPQELLIQNPIGNNLALELRTNSGPDAYYGCPPSFFDGVFVRVVDREEPGGLNNTLFRKTGYSGDVIIPNSYSSTNCANFTLLNYAIPVGQVMHSQLGDIFVQSITNLPSGGKQATVNINYIQPQCIQAPPTGDAFPTTINLYNNPLIPSDFNIPQVLVENNNICNTGSEVFSITTQVPTLPGATVTINTPPLNSIESDYFNFPIPSALLNLVGLYPYLVTVSKLSNPAHSFSDTGNFTLQTYIPKIYGPYGMSYCLDQDPVPFTWQNLGANFLSYYPNVGAVVTPNPAIPGLPPTFYVPDLCPEFYRATDVVCGSNTGIPSIANAAFFIIGDCRFYSNSPFPYCYQGTCP